MKKLAASLLATLLLATCFSVTVFASSPTAVQMEEEPLLVNEDVGVQPFWAVFTSGMVSIDVDNLGKITAGATMAGVPGYDIYIVITIQQQQSNATWKDIKSFESPKRHLASQVEGNWYVARGTYRTHAAFYAYDSSTGKLVETASANSRIIKY